MSDTASADCRRNSWWVAIGAGVLVMLMLLLVAKSGFLSSLLIGAIVAIVLGFFLGWAFCSKIDARQEAVVAPAPPRPAPAAQPQAAAEPAPASPVASADVMTETAAPAAVASQPAPKPKAKPKPKAAKPAAEKPAKKQAMKASTAAGLDAALAKSKDAPATGAPELLTAPRGGRADDLKMIRGIGPKLEALLNSVGVWHFDQIASWKAKNIAFVDERMEGFKGRITRDEWVKQAKVLAKGGRTEFSERVSKGDVY